MCIVSEKLLFREIRRFQVMFCEDVETIVLSLYSTLEKTVELAAHDGRFNSGRNAPGVQRI